MELAAKNNLNKPCPHDGRVLYLESPGGKAYFDTEIAPVTGMTYDIVSQYVTDPTGSYMTVCGVYNNPTFRITYISNYGQPKTTGSWFIEGFSGRPSNFDDIAYWHGKMKDDSKLTLTLFAQNETTNVAGFSPYIRIYSYKCYAADGTLLQDFIPVRYRDDGAFYDKVGGKMFLNQGTTNKFLLGPDVKGEY